MRREEDEEGAKKDAKMRISRVFVFEDVWWFNA